MPIITTSMGISIINLPFKENMIIIVNNNAIRVIGEMAGMNSLLYQSAPFLFTSNSLVRIPNRIGISR